MKLMVPRSGALSLVAKRLVAKGCGAKWVLAEIVKDVLGF